MRKVLGLMVGAFLLMAGSAFAQTTATGASKYQWTQPNVADAATAQSFTYKVYDDGSATGRTIASVTCSVAGTPVVVTCQAPILAYTPGTHTAQATAGNAAGESLKSNTISFQFVVVPSTPTNFQLAQLRQSGQLG